MSLEMARLKMRAGARSVYLLCGIMPPKREEPSHFCGRFQPRLLYSPVPGGGAGFFFFGLSEVSHEHTARAMASAATE